MLLCCILLSGCIKNDLPYPKIPQNITALAVPGELKTAYIDSVAREATVYLDEATDIENVHFSEFKITPGADASINLLEGSYNLTSPLRLAVSRYQTYNWEIRAVQKIERYFEVEGQVGESIIDPAACRVIVTMPDKSDLSALILEKVKLGPNGITEMTPALLPGTIDLSHPLRVEVTAHGRSEYWTIYVDLSESVVTTERVDAWSQVIWAYGNCPSDLKGGFQYKESGASEWINVPSGDISQNQGVFSCCIPHLDPLKEYTIRSVSGSHIGNEVKVKTESTEDLPDGDFDQWWLKNNKIWCPWNENGTQFWDTGNTGAATLGQSNVVPSDYTPSGVGKSAELNTKFVGIGIIGKLAAGSVFTGKFNKVDGTNGILDFGQPWNLRPVKLKGYYQYKTAPINYVSEELEELKNRPDTCHIYVALTDWTAPFEIRTNPKNRNLFNKDADYVIGYGELVYSGTMDSYEEFEIKINYRSTSKKPSFILIAAAASKYGDFFTGGAGAQLYVDQFSLSYDY